MLAFPATNLRIVGNSCVHQVSLSKFFFFFLRRVPLFHPRRELKNVGIINSGMERVVEETWSGFDWKIICSSVFKDC